MPLEGMTIVDMREEMAQMALDKRYKVAEIARLFGVSRPTVRHWRERYRENGRGGLEDGSHAPQTCPHRTDPAIEQLIIEERKRYGWGAKKILRRLSDEYLELQLPACSTVNGILARHGLSERQGRRGARGGTPFARRYEASEPGELSTIDFKGQFRLLSGRYCFPLTIVDHVSRYLLACAALESNSYQRAWPVIRRVFQEHGLPRAMQSDNGPPFGPTHGRFSYLSVQLMTLDVQPVFGRPGVPQDNARHERMHRDLKREATRPPRATLPDQQKKFDEFVHTYNVERPHEGIGMRRPVAIYTNSARPYPARTPDPHYPAHWETRKITQAGLFKWHQEQIFITDALAGRIIAFEPADQDLWTVHFYNFTIGKFDQRTNTFL